MHGNNKSLTAFNFNPGFLEVDVAVSYGFNFRAEQLNPRLVLFKYMILEAGGAVVGDLFDFFLCV
jgi:hypothetical protein